MAGYSPPPTPRGSRRRKQSEDGRENGEKHHEPQTRLERSISNSSKRLKSFYTRVWSSLWMIGGFSVIIWMGHVFIWGLVLVLQILMVRELFSLASISQKQKPRLRFTFLNWHFFFTAAAYVYGRFMDQQLLVAFTSDESTSIVRRAFATFTQYHLMICYTMYITGFVWFILTLEKGRYKAQFGQYAWTHMILFVVFFQSSFFPPNIFQGIIWFLLPASLIIVNDCAAYLFGVFFGRTPLIKLSPKKTWEGFLGASITTIIAAFLLAGIMGKYTWLTCPRKDLSIGPLQCNPGPMFEPATYPLPGWLARRGYSTVTVMPVQLHALVFGVFASSIAPFGGFFASGFKRAFKIKDFGDVIPGHGGITDRMDCQMVMAVFAYIYYNTFIAPSLTSVESMLSKVVSMNIEQQMELYVRLGNALVSQGIRANDLRRSANLWPPPLP